MSIAAKRLIDVIPDLVVAVTRDGVILSHGGGLAMPDVALAADCPGSLIDDAWPAEFARGVRRLIRKSISVRGSVEATIGENQRSYRVRVTPEGPDRALCVIRLLDTHDQHAESASRTGSMARPYLDRRGFMKRFEQVVAQAALTELPVTAVVIHLVGIEDIARIDPKLAEQVVTIALVRLAVELPPSRLETNVCVGQLSDSQLAFVLRTADRAMIEAFVKDLSEGLFAPIDIERTTFTLAGYAGVAVLGRDSSSSKGLLDNARIAANEARHSEARRPRFFSDTMKLKSLARLDIARELRDAIEARAVEVRYVARHELKNMRLDAVVGYVRWRHPLRGDISPKEFLSVAETTGSALPLSRSILKSLVTDFNRLPAARDPAVRISFGPLRQHVLHEEFISDLQHCAGDGNIPLSSLEVRIAESIFIALPGSVCDGLHDLGIRVVVDEVGRGFGSLDRIARSPVWGMQLDRAWVSDICIDELARKVCTASIATSDALGVASIATGVDDTLQRLALVELGCRYGSGDLFEPVQPPLVAAGVDPRARRSEDANRSPSW